MSALVRPSSLHAAGSERTGRDETTVQSPRPRRRSWRRDVPLLLTIVPAAALLALFFVGPAAWGIWASLTDRALLGPAALQTQFIGLDNYRRLWETPDLAKFVRNTIVFVIGSAVIGQTGLGFALALLLDHARAKHARLGPVAYAAVLVAWISPPALAGAIWGQVLEYRHGELNAVLMWLGLDRVDLLSEHQMLAVIIADVWRGTAFAMVIFLGALQTIPESVYEAARVDGANAWHRFRDHTLPLIAHLGLIVLMMTTIVTMGSFLLIYILTNGGTNYETETIALYAYHRAFVTFEIGYGAAISVVMLVLNLLFAAVYLRIARVEE